MFDIGWQELFIVTVLALIVIGPKDLPRAVRAMGKWVRKARTLARDFQGGLDDVMREAELDDLKKGMETASSLDIAGEIEHTIDPTGDIAGGLDMSDLETDLDTAALAAPDTAAPAQAAQAEPEKPPPKKAAPRKAAPKKAAPRKAASKKAAPAAKAPAAPAGPPDSRESAKTPAKASG